MNFRNQTINLGIALGVLLSNANTHAIILDGKEVDFEGKQRISITTEVEMPSNVMFRISGDQIDLGWLKNPSLVEKWDQYYQQTLAEHKRCLGCSIEAGEGIFIDGANGVTSEASFLKSGKEIKLNGGPELSIMGTISEASEDIILIGRQIKLQTFFAKTPMIVRILAPEDSNSWLEGVSFSNTYDRSSQFGLEFDGLLNFDNLSETQGDDAFSIIGTNKITFHFKKV